MVEITNRLAPEFGYREALKGLSTRQLIRYSGIPLFKIPGLIRRLRVELKSYNAIIPPCGGMPGTIQQLHAQGYSLAIITSNTPEVVQTFLAAHGLDHCFIGINGGTLFGKGRLIAKCLERYQCVPEKTVYIGDEVRDIQAARFAGIRSVAVTWGFNSRGVLAAAQPDWLVDEPDGLGEIAHNLSRLEI